MTSRKKPTNVLALLATALRSKQAAARRKAAKKATLSARFIRREGGR